MYARSAHFVLFSGIYVLKRDWEIGKYGCNEEELEIQKQ